MWDFALFATGCFCAAIGGELFVQGLLGIAQRGRLPTGVVAATLGAFATSSPELVVGVTSALRGVPEISLGDVLGSNVVNIALILAIPMVIAGLRTTYESTFRDLPFALVIFPAIWFVARDGRIDAADALILLAVFLLWFVLVLVWAVRNRTPDDGTSRTSGALLLAITIVGLLTLFLAGQLIVTGATGLATAAGLPAFLIGATLVAFGTSVPELATVVVSSMRGHHEVGLQTILGSNIFNTLLIIPVAALIHPITVNWAGVSLALAFGFGVTLLTAPVVGSRLGRWRGVALLAAYTAFIAMSLASVH